MSEIKTAEEILKENCNIGFQKGTGTEWVSSSLESVSKALESYLQSRKPTDEEIESMVNKQHNDPCYRQGYREGQMELRDKIFIK